MLEFEKKIILTETEYNLLFKELFSESAEVNQTNYYYDTDDFKLNSLNITCRIRSKDGKFKAVFKAHQSKDSDCSVEISETAENQYDTALFKDMNLKLQGCLKTYRLNNTRYPGIVLYLDKNSYLGITDYELEIEYRSGKNDLAVSILNSLARRLYSYRVIPDLSEFVKRASCSKSKSERFFERKLNFSKK